MEKACTSPDFAGRTGCRPEWRFTLSVGYAGCRYLDSDPRARGSIPRYSTIFLKILLLFGGLRALLISLIFLNFPTFNTLATGLRALSYKGLLTEPSRVTTLYT